MPRSIHRCPNCREPVSPFAAGCALCGTDLEAARRELADRKAARPSVSMPRTRFTTGGSMRLELDWLQLLIALLLSLFVTVIGLIFSLYWARRHQQEGSPSMMWAMLLCAGVAIWAYLDPWWFASHLYGGI